MRLAVRIVFAPIWITALVLDKAICLLSPRTAAIIAGADEAYRLTEHSNDDYFHLWELDLKAKETS